MSLQLKQLIREATQLVPNGSFSDYSYGPRGEVRPGLIVLLAAIGPYQPERGYIWLQDDRHGYWEVSDEELQRAI